MDANGNEGSSSPKHGAVARLGRGLGRLIPIVKSAGASPSVVVVGASSNVAVEKPQHKNHPKADFGPGELDVVEAKGRAPMSHLPKSDGGRPEAVSQEQSRHLGASIQETNEPATSQGSILSIPLSQITPNRNQPRKQFDQEGIKGLASSIEATGLIQPITVRRIGSGYEIIAGERRFRAFQELKRGMIPCIVQSADDRDAAVRSLVENIQREDLNPMDRAEGMKRLATEFVLTQQEVARRVGLDRASVANLLRLCELDPWTAGCVRSGNLSQGHAKALLAITNPSIRKKVGEQSVSESWSVRQLEREVQRLQSSMSPNQRLPHGHLGVVAHLADLERRIGAKIGTKVTIKSGRKQGTGSVTLEFYSNEQFEGLLGLMGVPADEL